MWLRIKALMDTRLFRYGISGGATFAVNMGVMYALIQWAQLNRTDFQSNVSHLLSTEASIIFSFHAHSFFTWKERSGHYFTRLWHFHLLTGVTIVLRQIGFYILNDFGQHWIVSTIIPLIVAIIINFFGYDRVVFRGKLNQTETEKR